MDECINEVYIIMLMSMMLYDINDADTDDDAEVPGDLCRPVTKANLALVKFYKKC